ncbi:MAG: D-glycerate dehydrogenase [Chloroflexi bacterium]|nr:D-glycerate dehydrogenase [Chloroflexota bacterium]MCC6896520.1 D-glycerate dehydrogenase [Anaerolineae bacterium]
MMRPKVFVSRIIPEAGLKLVREACDAEVWPDVMPPPYEVLTEKVKMVDGMLCTLNDRIDAALIEAAGSQFKIFSQMAVGYDNINAKAAHARGILIGNTPGVLTDATADIAFALLLAAARRIVEGMEYIREGKWRTWEPLALLGADLSGATLGIIGLGRIGEAVARRAKGFDMRIIAYSPSKKAEDVAKLGIELVSLDELLQQSDFVSIHVPLNDQTRGMINADALGKMKPTAILINTARGPIVDQEALIEAAKNGTIGGAALDVTTPEPLPSDHPLLYLPNVTVVPHIGSASQRTRDKMATMAAENLIAGVNGQPIPNQVKPS